MRLVIAGDQPSIRRAVSLLVRTRLGIEIVGETGNIGELMKLVDAAKPDLILLDVRLPGAKLNELIATLDGLDYSPSVVVLNERPEMEEAALAAGAEAFVHKGGHPKQLLIAIESVRIKRGDHQKT